MANLMHYRRNPLRSYFGEREPFWFLREALRADSDYGVSSSSWTPAFEGRETDKAYVLKADLPGVELENLEISVNGGRLVVSGKREAEEGEDGETYFACERCYGTFSRTFTLPETADGEHIEAGLKSGVLTLTVPKKPEVLPKQIEVKQID